MAHRAEDLLKELEGGTREPTAELADLLLVSTDAAEALVAQARGDGAATADVTALLDSLKAGALPAVPGAPGPFPTSAATVRTSVQRLDQVANQMGELLILRGAFEDRGRQLTALRHRLETFLANLRRAEKHHALRDILGDLARLGEALEKNTLELGQLAETAHTGALELRMLPLSTITEELQRMVRDLARTQGKEIQLSIEGDSMELDRQMIEILKPSLLHLLRNAVDHGIERPEVRRQRGKPERGTIRLAANQGGGGLQLRVSDDGAGIEAAQVRHRAVQKGLLTEEEAAALTDEKTAYLTLRPGFSTRERTTDISGRGVGLDVVNTNIEQVKGNLTLHSAPGQGTEFALDLPLTMTAMTGLIIEVAEQTYAVPLHYVAEVLHLRAQDILCEGNREVVRVRARNIPIVPLAESLGHTGENGAHGRLTALVLTWRDRHAAFTVSLTLETREIVVKGLGPRLKGATLFSGATILGDGVPVLILSPPALFADAPAAPDGGLRRSLSEEQARSGKGRRRVLVVDDSTTTRTMEKNILDARGYSVTVAVCGEEALQRAAEEDFDLVLSDVEMPGIDGFELTRRLRGMERFREVPVIICSSLAEDEHKRRGIEAGAQAYIVKGRFDQGTLLETVESLIG